MARPDYLTLGRILKVHGVQGEMKAACLTEPWLPFQTLAHLWVGPPEGPPRCFKLEAGRKQGREAILKLEGVDTPAAASRLIGQEVSMLRAEAPAPPEGHFYHSDILGLLVVEGERALGS